MTNQHPLIEAIRLKKAVKSKAHPKVIAVLERRIKMLAAETMGRIGSYIDTLEVESTRRLSVRPSRATKSQN